MKKALGILLILAGVVAFFSGNILKSRFLVFEERKSSNGIYEFKQAVEEGHSYKIVIIGDDEEGALQKWAEVSFNGEIKDGQGEVLFEKSVKSSSSPASSDSGRVRTTQSLSYTHIAKGDDILSIAVDFNAGDYVEVTIFKDIPDILDMTPGIGIIVAFVGLILFLKGRAAKKVE